MRIAFDLKAKTKFENTTHLVVDTEPMPTVVVSNGLVRVESESRRAEQVALVIFNSISNLNTLTSLYMTWTDDVILMSHWSTSP